MTRLERRYRRLLRLLPGWYRAEREDEMVSVFLAGAGGAPDGADEEDVDPLWGEYGWPDGREVAAVAGLAARVRFGGTGTAGRSRAAGDTVRLVALLGLLANAVTAVLHPVSLLSAAWRGGPLAQFVPRVLAPETAGDWYSAAGTLLALLWVPAYLLLTCGLRRAARLLAVLAVLASLVTLIGDVVVGVPAWFPLVIRFGPWLPAACALLGFHREAPRPRPRPWLLAFALAVVVAGGCTLAGLSLPVKLLALAAGGLVLLVVRSASPARVRPSWLAALAVLIAAEIVPVPVNWLAAGMPTGLPGAWFAIPTGVLGLVAVGLLVAIARRPRGRARPA